jgi:hypothetical protein
MEYVNGAASMLPWEIAWGGAAAVENAQPVLPRGRVEMVLVVDEAKRVEGRKWRLSFEYAAFGYDPDGRPRRETQIIPRVAHCFRVLHRVMSELVKAGFRPVYGRKETGDEFAIGLWKQATNPPVPAIEVCEYPVRLFEVDDGKQCPFGFDETAMAVVTNVEEFAP